MSDVIKMRGDFVRELRSVVGTRYRYGGQSPEDGFDCSGLVVWGLQRVGVSLPDLSAAGLYDYFHTGTKDFLDAAPGDLLFYGRPSPTHVMVVNMVWARDATGRPLMTLIGARGGDSGTTTTEAAYKDNAMVSVVSGDYWRDNMCGVRSPF